MEAMLNLANNIPEDEAVKLVETSVEYRTMDLYFAHNGMLVAFGYVNGDLVWFSYTSIRDTFLSRRIFDCMKFGKFYRRVTVERALATAGLVEESLLSMCHARISNIEEDYPVFTGCVEVRANSENSQPMTGDDFAEIAAALPDKLRQFVSKVGSDDDIIMNLEADYQTLEELYKPDESISDQKQQIVHDIVDKWAQVDFLKMAERAAIRSLYKDVRYHRYATGE
ncbi:MAG: hypothetical protein K6C13_05965 [Oscillospiraceae bacterium]|nr:hypothetical protein [Oscillospiraceae bacterium]